MLICLCNNVRDKDICEAVSGGAGCAKEVYRSLNCTPKCGACVSFIQENYFSEMQTGSTNKP